MKSSQARKASARRAAIVGALMAFIVFGGAIAYFFSSRPKLYRAQGGDVWVFLHYRAKPYQSDTLVKELAQKVRNIDHVEGFWGMEVLQKDASQVSLLTRWRTKADYEKFHNSPHADAIKPDADLLLGKPTIESWKVLAR